MKKILILMVVCVLFVGNEVQGQSLPTIAGPGNASQDRDERRMIEWQQRMDIARDRMNGRIESKDENGMIFKEKILFPKGTRERELEEKIKDENRSKKMVKPSKDNVDKYANFLLKKDTGIAKIFSNIRCAPIVAGRVISVEELERCLNVPNIAGNGSFYSFKIRKNYLGSYDWYRKDINQKGWWDIQYTDQHFVVGNCCIQGIVSDIGRVDIENIAIDSPATTYLTDFKPKTTFEEIHRQNQLLHKGIKSGNYTYQKTVPAKVGNTYALRSIKYNVRSKKSKGDDSELKVISDDLTVFKVVEIGSDGSLIIIWKHLPMKKNK